MESSGFANGNQNVGLFIKGEAGSGQTVELRNTTFENCVKRSMFCRGILVFNAVNCQIYNNNDYVAETGFEFDASNFIIRQVNIENITVRATASNTPFTAFKISGGNADLKSCRVRNVNWENFDYSGQIRFDGWEFDNVPNTGELVVETATSVLFRPKAYIGEGRSVPFRLRGPTAQSPGGVASTSGEWIPLQIPSSGLAVPLTSVLANTRYWCYLYDNAGTPAIEVSNAASQVTNTASGYAVKSVDPTRYYIGSILGGVTDGTAATTGIGWLNPTTIANGGGINNAYLWVDSSGKLRIKSSGVLPANDTDGTIVGTQS